MWETGEKTASTIVRPFSMCYENDSRERKSGALFLERRENFLSRERNRVWNSVVGFYIVTSEKKERCAFFFPY